MDEESFQNLFPPLQQANNSPLIFENSPSITIPSPDFAPHKAKNRKRRLLEIIPSNPQNDKNDKKIRLTSTSCQLPITIPRDPLGQPPFTETLGSNFSNNSNEQVHISDIFDGSPFRVSQSLALFLSITKKVECISL
jgi:hypothetical protein